MIETGVYPENFKILKITPIYKNNKNSCATSGHCERQTTDQIYYYQRCQKILNV